MDLIEIGRLTDEQKQVLYLRAHGDHVILGAAGSGKSLMAAHRALWLARGLTICYPTLIVTYTNALAKWFKSVAEFFDAGVEVTTFHALVKAKTGVTFWGGETNALRTALNDLSSDYPFVAQWDASFIASEVAWIQGLGIDSIDEYLETDRTGRLAPLHKQQRSAVWEIMERAESTRPTDRVPYGRAGSVLLEALLAKPADSTHIIIDEGQDLPPECIRALSELKGPDGSLTWFGDYAQQIYGRGISFRNLGLNIGAIHRFHKNHRTTRRIATLAECIRLARVRVEGDDVTPAALGEEGERPVLYEFTDRQIRNEWLYRQVIEFVAQGLSVAVLAPHDGYLAFLREELGSNAQQLRDRGVAHERGAAQLGSIHASKGLAFDVVFVPFLSRSEFPSELMVARSGQQAAHADALTLLYVAVTRAKKRIVLGYVGELSPIFPADAPVLHAAI